jgi:hypothetical protein
VPSWDTSSSRRPVLVKGHLAETDRSDQALVSQGHHGRYLFVERHIGLGMAPKVHHRHLIELERRQVGQYAIAQSLVDQFVGNAKPVVVRGVQVPTFPVSLPAIIEKSLAVMSSGAVPRPDACGGAVIGGEISSARQVARVLFQTAGGGEAP